MLLLFYCVQVDVLKLYEVCLALIQVYAKCNTGEWHGCDLTSVYVHTHTHTHTHTLTRAYTLRLTYMYELATLYMCTIHNCATVIH